jgi:hypothetical protein
MQSHDTIVDNLIYLIHNSIIRGLSMKCSPQYYVVCLGAKLPSLESLGVVKMVML